MEIGIERLDAGGRIEVDREPGGGSGEMDRAQRFYIGGRPRPRAGASPGGSDALDGHVGEWQGGFRMVDGVALDWTHTSD